jgi:hypothetical protein
VAYHQREVAAAAQQQPPPPPGAPPPPPPTQWSVVTAPPPPPPPGEQAVGPPAAPPDPTRGVITNGTLWEIHVFVDQPPESPNPLVLRPGADVSVVLDIGQHRIIAQAFVDTQLGRRLVGTFDRTLTIHFFPTNF